MPVGSGEACAVVLAAGEGKRLKSSLPKVLHRIAGRSLLEHVLAALDDLTLAERVVVVSPRAREGGGSLPEDLTLVVQDPPRGTGDAVRVGLDALPQEGVVLVLPGDTPLVEGATLARLLTLRESTGAAAALVSAHVHDARGYGRVVRGRDDTVERIVEEADATETERQIDEINGSIYAFDIASLREVLTALDADNAQGELYLTDAVALLRERGEKVVALRTRGDEISGVNSRAQLAKAAALLRERSAERWMDEGVTIVDPATTYIDPTVSIGKDAVIHPFTFLEGETSIGDRAEVGPQTRIVDSVVGDGANVTFAVVRGSRIGADATVGPFASLRPGTQLGRGSRLGTFVETKNTTLGDDSKANHLAYLGDAQVGSGVNIGAGTITCNWDGVEKHQTVIDDDAYIASDTMLVAPLHIGKKAATGAGAVVRDDVPDGALAVGVPARIIEGKGDRMKKDDNPEAGRGG